MENREIVMEKSWGEIIAKSGNPAGGEPQVKRVNSEGIAG